MGKSMRPKYLKAKEFNHLGKQGLDRDGIRLKTERPMKGAKKKK